jgi:hypothetical protein
MITLPNSFEKTNEYIAMELAKKTHTFFQNLKEGKHTVVLNHKETAINVVIEKSEKTTQKQYWVGIDGVQHRIFKAPKGYMVLFVFGQKKYTKTYGNNQLYFN